jgi:NhaP-type Na+/H+ or K+/H+ antiporter
VVILRGTAVAPSIHVLMLLVFALALLAAVLLSSLAQRTLLSTSVLFLGAGFLTGDGVLGVVSVAPTDPSLQLLIEIALFSILFTDGMRLGIRDVLSAWRLPGRALLFGLPLTLLLAAALGWLLTDLSWVQALLLGAALSATDPVLAAALIGQQDVPYRLRHLLNVESGLNDGLALPIVLVLIAVLRGGHSEVGRLGLEALLGLALGTAIAWAAVRLGQSRFFGASARYEPLMGVAIGLLVFAAAYLTSANLFLAGFAAGVTVASTGTDVRRSFDPFGERVAELLKLLALLVFGALLSARIFADVGAAGWIFALATLLLVRPLALLVALAGSRLSRREWIAAAWFGPKGFASVVYALFILKAGLPQGELIFELIAVVTALSVLAHSSTDVLVARWFHRAAPSGALEGTRA